MRSPTGKRPAFHPQPALPDGPEWPEVTTVFCGPAQYKVTTVSVSMWVCVCVCVTEHSTLNTAACLLVLQYSTLNTAAYALILQCLYSTLQLVCSFCNSGTHHCSFFVHYAIVHTQHCSLFAHFAKLHTQHSSLFAHVAIVHTQHCSLFAHVACSSGISLESNMCVMRVQHACVCGYAAARRLACSVLGHISNGKT